MTPEDSVLNPMRSKVLGKLQAQLDAYELEHGKEPDVLLIEEYEHTLFITVPEPWILKYNGIRVSTPQREYDPLKHWGIRPKP